VVYEAQHKFNEAVELYKKYIESHPGRVDMKLRLGKAYLQDRKYLESAKVMDEILRIDPTNRDVRLTMGMAFFLRKRLRPGSRRVQDAAEAGPL